MMHVPAAPVVDTAINFLASLADPKNVSDMLLDVKNQMADVVARHAAADARDVAHAARTKVVADAEAAIEPDKRNAALQLDSLAKNRAAFEVAQAAHTANVKAFDLTSAAYDKNTAKTTASLTAREASVSAREKVVADAEVSVAAKDKSLTEKLAALRTVVG